MSRGWRARLRRRLCAPFRAARSCRVARGRRDDRQRELFPPVEPSRCAAELGEGVALRGAQFGDGCACGPRGIAWCDVLQPSERAAVRAAVLAFMAANAASRGE